MVAGDRMVDIDHHFPGEHVRIGKHLIVIEHRPGRNTCFLKLCQPVLAVLELELLLYQSNQLVIVRNPFGIGTKTGSFANSSQSNIEQRRTHKCTGDAPKVIQPFLVSNTW